MQTAPLGTSELALPVVAVGCMRLRQLDLPAAERFVGAALEQGARARTFPGAGHARSGSGGGAPDPVPPRHVILLSQCGIRLGAYDVSRERVLVSVEGSLRCLGTAPWTSCGCTGRMRWWSLKRWRRRLSSGPPAAKCSPLGSRTEKPMQMELLAHYVPSRWGPTRSRCASPTPR